MVGASKILTVSYGTFSCTLEGFDDSFETMKAIAEYFRDLAADDRYFGAEPPVPDGEMLARIAEREIQSRVEAHVTDNNVVLRARAADEAPELAAPASAPTARPATKPAQVAAETPSVAEIVDDVAENAPMFPATEDPDIESVAAKLKRIRAVVSKAKAATAVSEAEEIADEISEEQAAPVQDESVSESEIAEADAAEISETANATDDATDIDGTAVSEDLAQADEAEAEVSEEVLEESAPDGQETPEEEPQAEELAQSEEELAETGEADAAEAEPELAAEDDTEEDTETNEELAVATDEEPVEDAANETTEDQNDEAGDETPDESGNVLVLDTLVTEESVEEITDESPSDEATDESPENGAISALLDEICEDEGDLVAENDEIEDDDAELDDEETLAAILDADTQEDPQDSNHDDEDKAEEEDAPLTAAQRARARLIKLKKAGFGLVSSSDSPEVAEENAFTEDQEDADATDLKEGPEDEEESLFAEDDIDETELMAKIQSDLDEGILSADDETDLINELTDSEEDDADSGNTSHVRRTLLENEEVDEEAGRILDETNHQFDAPEGTRRRSAISHLRAAVAATVADRLLKGGKSEAESEDEAEPYREDLAQVIRPRRPSRGNSPARLAPLMLVSEQRIDEQPEDEDTNTPEQEEATDTTPVTPIRPRRIRKEDLAASGKTKRQEEANPEDALWDEEKILADSTSFTEFAQRMGATELPDLLEAAAAYASYVEGRPHFSRPQIMRQVANASAEAGFNREDSLRSFGQLLRQGKIRKVKRGLFVIAETTRFKPESRIAGE